MLWSWYSQDRKSWAAAHTACRFLRRLRDLILTDIAECCREPHALADFKARILSRFSTFRTEREIAMTQEQFEVRKERAGRNGE